MFKVEPFIFIVEFPEDPIDKFVFVDLKLLFDIIIFLELSDTAQNNINSGEYTIPRLELITEYVCHDIAFDDTYIKSDPPDTNSFNCGDQAILNCPTVSITVVQLIPLEDVNVFNEEVELTATNNLNSGAHIISYKDVLAGIVLVVHIIASELVIIPSGLNETAQKIDNSGLQQIDVKLKFVFVFTEVHKIPLLE
jgi:hypothetical protein